MQANLQDILLKNGARHHASRDICHVWIKKMQDK